MTSTAKNDPLAAPVDGGGGKGKTRPFRIVAMLGAPASGKTSQTQVLVDGALSRGRDVRILDPADNWPGVGEWPETKDDEREPEDIAEAWIRAILRQRKSQGASAKPLTIVLEDADAYLTKPPRPVWKRLFATFRHYKIDLIINARRTQDLPLLIFTSATNVYLFRHFVSVDYIRANYGADVVRAIPKEPFVWVLLDVENHELYDGKTKPRAVRTASDDGGGSSGWF